MNNSDSVLKAIQFKRTSAIEYANQKMKEKKQFYQKNQRAKKKSLKNKQFHDDQTMDKK